MSIKSHSRKNFLSWTLAVTSMIALPSLFFRKSKEKKQSARTAKMLTKDGRLVEVDLSALPSRRTSIRDEEIHTWINKKQGF